MWDSAIKLFVVLNIFFLLWNRKKFFNAWKSIIKNLFGITGSVFSFIHKLIKKVFELLFQLIKFILTTLWWFIPRLFYWLGWVLIEFGKFVLNAIRALVTIMQQ